MTLRISAPACEQLALLATGTACVVVGGAAVTGFGVFAAPVVGLFGLRMKPWLDRLMRNDPDSERAVRRVQERINATLRGRSDIPPLTAEQQVLADEELPLAIARHWPVPKKLVALAAEDQDGFPDAVANHVMERIDMALSSAELRALARTPYAHAVIKAALQAGLEERTYVETLQPEAMMTQLELTGEAVRGIRKLETLPARLETLEAAMDEVRVYLRDIRTAAEELREVARDLESGLRADNAALRGDLDRLRGEVERLLAENITLQQQRGALDADVATNAESLRPLVRVIEAPEGEAERQAANYLLMDEPDLRAVLRALDQRAAAEEDDFVRARDALVETQLEIAAAAQYVDVARALAALERVTQVHPDHFDSWNRLGILRHRLGDLADALEAFRHVERIADLVNSNKIRAVAYGNIGNVALTRGDLDGAMRFHEIALALDEELGRKECMSPHYVNMGEVARTRGDLDGAMAYYKRSLEVEMELDRKEGIASIYGNMGIVAQMRGDLDGAIVFHMQSLALNEELGDKEGMANAYGNMGILAQTRGDLDRGMRYYKQSLTLNKELGHKKGMANNFGNMGEMARFKGDLDGAVRFYEQSLALNKELGRKEGIATQYGNMGIVAQTRGNLDGAMTYYEQALVIEKELDRKEGLAIQYSNMGSLEKERGDLAATRSLWEKALALFDAMGSANSATVRGWLDDLDG